jgi:hypothetical protein
MCLTHIGAIIKCCTIHAYSKKLLFWPPNSIVPRWYKGKNPSTLNLMILQMVRNECVRFGGHIDVQVNYKILTS